MLAMFSPVSLEAQKIITVSIGKINASRVTRTGASLHKSLLVTTMLHKARNIYFEEERERAARYPCPPSPELTVTPVCLVNNNIPANDVHDDNKENRLDCREDEVAVAERTGEESRLPLAEANTGNMTLTTTTTTTVTSITATTTCSTTTSSSQNSSRKRRRVSDQETAAAISSILPKRLRSELKEDSTKQEVKCTSETHNTSEEERQVSNVLRPCETNCLSVPTRVSSLPDVSTRLSVTTSERGKVHEDSPSFLFSYDQHSNPSFTTTQDDKEEESTADDSEDSDSDDSASDTSSSSCGEMEVDHLTSLVSYFSFSQTQKQSDYCIVPLHHSQSAPHIVALTA